MRTATHAFNLKGKTYAKYTWNSKEWDGGFGRQVPSGETWVNHHGNHGKESTRGIIAAGAKEHPILRGIRDGDIWGPTDVYEAHPPADCTPLVLGEVLAGMTPKDKPVDRHEERPDDARRLDQDLQHRGRQKGTHLHHHDGGRDRP